MPIGITQDGYNPLPINQEYWIIRELREKVKNGENLTPEESRLLSMNDAETSAKYQYAQFSDPNSQYYQDMRKQLTQAVSDVSPTLGTLLGLQRAAGVGGELGGRIASEQREAQERHGAEVVGSNVRGAQLQGAQIGAEGTFNVAQLEEQRRQFEESQPGFWEQIAPVVGAGLGFLVGGPLGAGIGYSVTQGATSSSTQGVNRVQTNYAGFYDPQANSNFGNNFNPNPGADYYNPNAGFGQMQRNFLYP